MRMRRGALAVLLLLAVWATARLLQPQTPMSREPSEPAAMQLAAPPSGAPTLRRGARPSWRQGPGHPDASAPMPRAESLDVSGRQDDEAPRAGAAGTLRVRLARPHGWSQAPGIVYVLAAGTRGARDLSFSTHAHWVAGRQALDLPVAGPGPWDVFFLCGQGRLQALDVRVDAEQVDVTLHAPTSLPLRVDFRDPPEPNGDFQLLVRSADDDYLAAPGRFDPVQVQLQFDLQAAGATDSPPLALGQAYQLRVKRSVEASPQPATAPWQRWRAQPATARAGERVELVAVPYGVVEVSATLAQPAPPEWAARKARLGIWLPVKRDGRIIGSGYTWLPTAVGADAPRPVRIPVDAGAALLEVHANGAREVRPIKLEVLAGTTHRVDLPMSLDAQSGRMHPSSDVIMPIGSDRAPPRNVAVTLDLGPQTEGGAQLRIFGARPGHEHEPLEASWSGLPEDIELDSEWLQATGLVATYGDWVSAPLTPRTTGALHFELSRGGWLIVVPWAPTDPRLGRLRLRRTDGLPLQVGFASEDGWDRERTQVQREALVSPSSLIGPLPPGPIRLEAWLGSQRLPDARAVVRAGRFEPLRLGP